MKSTTQKGMEAEQLALEWLQQRGFALLERNYRVGHKEIDLIVESPHAVHIVEVKALSQPSAMDPAEKVGAQKRRLLAAAANYYLRSHAVVKDAQFDIVTVVFGEGKPKLEYIPQAFYPIYYK